MLQENPSWCVLLIGGLSALGKTVASKRIGRSLGVPWTQVDDLRLAFQRARVSLPESKAPSLRIGGLSMYGRRRKEGFFSGFGFRDGLDTKAP